MKQAERILRPHAEPATESRESLAANTTARQSLGALAVMSINMNGQPDWYPDEPEKQWATRAPLVRKTIENESPEIIGFQEFGETTEEDVFDSWSENPYNLYKGESVGDIFINTIAWNRARFTARDRLTRWLTPDGTFGQAWGGIERGYSAVLLEDHPSNQPLWVYNVHLDNVSAQARLEGIKLILGDIEERTGELPVAITGDFNAASWPMPPPPREGYYDPKVPISAQSDQEMFERLEAAGFTDTNTTGQIAGEASKPTFHAYLGDAIYRQPDKFGVWRPDRIFVRQLGVLAFKIISTNRDGIYPSDHYPIQATLSDTA